MFLFDCRLDVTLAFVQLVHYSFNFCDTLRPLLAFTVFLSMTVTDVSLSKYLHGGCSGAVLGVNGINSVEIGLSVVHLVLILQ